MNASVTLHVPFSVCIVMLVGSSAFAPHIADMRYAGAPISLSARVVYTRVCVAVWGIESRVESHLICDILCTTQRKRGGGKEAESSLHFRWQWVHFLGGNGMD